MGVDEVITPLVCVRDELLAYSRRDALVVGRGISMKRQNRLDDEDRGGATGSKEGRNMILSISLHLLNWLRLWCVLWSPNDLPFPPIE